MHPRILSRHSLDVSHVFTNSHRSLHAPQGSSYLNLQSASAATPVILITEITVAQNVHSPIAGPSKSGTRNDPRNSPRLYTNMNSPTIAGIKALLPAIRGKAVRDKTGTP